MTIRSSSVVSRLEVARGKTAWPVDTMASSYSGPFYAGIVEAPQQLTSSRLADVRGGSTLVSRALLTPSAPFLVISLSRTDAERNNMHAPRSPTFTWWLIVHSTLLWTEDKHHGNIFCVLLVGCINMRGEFDNKDWYGNNRRKSKGWSNCKGRRQSSNLWGNIEAEREAVTKRSKIPASVPRHLLVLS